MVFAVVLDLQPLKLFYIIPNYDRKCRNTYTTDMPIDIIVDGATKDEVLLYLGLSKMA